MRLWPFGRKAAPSKSPAAPSASDGTARGGYYRVDPPRQIDFAAKVGDGLASSVVMAPVNWIARTFPEAPVMVERLGGKQSEPVPDHPLLELLARPNRFYDGMNLWAVSLVSFCIAGNSYWLKVRNTQLKVIELWWAPHWAMAPRWNESTGSYLDYYEYRPGAVAPTKWLPEDVVHLRNGINPRNVRLGLGPLDSVLREVFSDDEASRYTATILSNMGVPGLVVSPAGDNVTVDAEEAAAIKKELRERTTGEFRGQPLVLRSKTAVEQFGFSPRDLDMSSLRDVSEERVCAALGLPAAIAGFGAGLETTKVGATMRELVKLAWDGCLLPMQRAMGEQLRQQLLVDFEPNPERFRVGFDTSRVAALQDNQNELATRLNSQLISGGILRSEYRQRLGYDVRPEDEVYLMPVNLIETGPGAPEDPAALPAKTQGKKGRKGRPTQAQRRHVALLERQAKTLQRAMAKRLHDVFRELGAQAAAAAQAVLGSQKAHKDAIPTIDELLTHEIIDQMGGVTAAVEHLKKVYGGHYLAVANMTSEAAKSMGVVVDVPDEVARQVVAEGGRRLGLVDLDEQTREALFDALHEGRSEGEGPPDLVRRIRDQIPAGPWPDAQTRARVIARTETIHAQRYSALTAYRAAANVTQVMMFDDRIGYGDADCSARDGRVVSFEEAQAAMEDEHPNGTLSFAPVVESPRRTEEGGD